MTDERFVSLVRQICFQDDRYNVDAYAFLTRALHYKTEKEKMKQAYLGHYILTCREAYDGFCEYGLDQMGVLAWAVFQEWGISSADDVGNMVYYMIAANLLAENPGDSREQFHYFPSLEKTMNPTAD